MSEKHPGPLVVEGKLSDAERMKVESNYLRGTIAEDLNDGLTGGFKGDNFLLMSTNERKTSWPSGGRRQTV